MISDDFFLHFILVCLVVIFRIDIPKMMAAMSEHMTSERQASSMSVLASKPDHDPSAPDVGASAAAKSVDTPSLHVTEEIAEKVHHRFLNNILNPSS